MTRRRSVHRPRRRVRIPFGKLFLALLIVCVLAYPFVEPFLIRVESRSLAYANLPGHLKNLRIVFVSDIHQGAFFSQSRVNDLVKRINALSPDVVLLGGDYAEDSAGAIAFFNNAPRIHARIAVRAVVGNHDRTAPESNFAELLAAMKNYGALPLNNYVDKIKIGSGYLYVAGVDDYYNGFPDVAGVAAQVRSDDFVIFLGHTPDLLADAFAATAADGDNHWFDLALFGHTHGGQFTLFGQPLVGGARPLLGKRYLTGWREENRANILVSNGIGTSAFPVRLFAPPQIHMITLKNK